MIISFPLDSRDFSPPPLSMAGSEIHGLLNLYVWYWELNLEPLGCTSSPRTLCFQHESMVWSSRTILCIPRIQWKATKTPVSTPPLGELVCEGWGWGCAPEGRMARPGSLCVGSSVEAEVEQWRLVWRIPEKPHSSSPQLCETHEPHFFFSKEKILRGLES